MSEHKYSYILNGKQYFIVLDELERLEFEEKYGLALELWEE